MHIKKLTKNVIFLLNLAEQKLNLNITGQTRYNLWLKCLAELKNPQNNFKVIQIVGTNGKGSTTMYLNHLLKYKYHKVATFISPATKTFYDRIQINNLAINDNQVGYYLKIIKPLISKYKLSFFQVWLLIALFFFTDNKVDIAIIEAGIGGRLDSTNIFTQKNQLAVAITSISLDHQEILGKTLNEIAEEKVAITLPLTPFFAPSNLYKYRKLFSLYSEKLFFVNPQIFDPEIAIYQNSNLGIAIAIAKNIFSITDINIVKIPKNIIFYRFSKVLEKPITILDGAHNDEAIKQVILNCQKLKYNFHVIAGFSKNKNIKSMQKIINKNFININYVNFEYKNSYVFNNDINYQTLIKKLIKSNINMLIIGSLYFVNEVYIWGKKNDLFK